MDPRRVTQDRTLPARTTGPVLALVLAVLATLLLAAPTSSARVADPSQDVPQLPRECIKYAIIPPVPVACQLVPFQASRPTVVLWGDSHAWQHIPAIQAAAEAKGVNLTAFVLGGCPPVKVAMARPPANPDGCPANNYLAMKYVKKLQAGPEDVRVLLGSHWAGYRRAARESTVPALAPLFGYDETTQGKVRLFEQGAAALFPALGRLGVDVDVIGQAATVPRATLPCLAGNEPYSCDLLRAQAVYDEQETEDWLRARMADLAGTPRLIDVNAGFCGQFTCRGLQDGVHTFFDDLHLSATRSATNARLFLPTMRALRR